MIPGSEVVLIDPDQWILKFRVWAFWPLSGFTPTIQHGNSLEIITGDTINERITVFLWWFHKCFPSILGWQWKRSRFDQRWQCKISILWILIDDHPSCNLHLDPFSSRMFHPTILSLLITEKIRKVNPLSSSLYDYPVIFPLKPYQATIEKTHQHGGGSNLIYSLYSY